MYRIPGKDLLSGRLSNRTSEKSRFEIVTDTVSSALSPTPPFPRDTARLRLAALLVPLFAISFVATSYMFVKGTMFGVGFAFFGDPVIQRSLAWLNQRYPNWQKLFELRKYVLPLNWDRLI